MTDLLEDQEGHSVKLEILRGMSNAFYMAVSDDLSGTDSLHQLTFTVDPDEGDTLQLQNKKLSTPTNDAILSLELAPSVQNSKESLTLGDEESGFDVSDALYLIDQRYCLHQIDVQGQASTPVSKIDLTKVDKVQRAIEDHVETTNFSRICINGSVLSIMGKNFNLHNGYKWDFVFDGRVPKSTYARKEVYKLEEMPLSQIQMALCYDQGSY